MHADIRSFLSAPKDADPEVPRSVETTFFFFEVLRIFQNFLSHVQGTCPPTNPQGLSHVVNVANKFLIETSIRRFLTLEYSPGIKLDLENLEHYLCAPVGGVVGAALVSSAPDVMCVLPI